MASETVEKDQVRSTPPPPPAAQRGSSCKCSVFDVFLRVLLLAASVVAVVVMVTSKQTKSLPVQVPGVGTVFLTRPAKFNYSPAFVYFVVAFSVTGLYSIISGLASLAALFKSSPSAKSLLLLIAYDVVVLGVAASAVGTAGGVAYVGLKGNSHVGWTKICSQYDKYCRYVGSSVAVGLFASVLLVVLVVLNAYTLYRRAEPRS